MAGVAPVKVYGPPLSTAVSRVLACLIEKDVPFQLVPVDMSKGEHKKPEFLKLQPFGQVPVFQDDEISLFGKVLDVYENRLGESRYLAGDEFSLADLSHLPNADYLTTVAGKEEMFSSRKNVGRWLDESMERESWKKVKELRK
ncbi:Glutathione S-transferase (Fragments) [Linum perenne]